MNNIFTRICSTLILMLFLTSNSEAQKPNPSTFTFSTEIIPFLYFPDEGAGDGFQVGLARNIGEKYKIQLTYGLNKYTYVLAGEYGISVGGVPTFIKKADESIFTPNEDRIEGVPDASKYEILENAGIKHYQPDNGAYTTNYLTVEFLRSQQIGQKWLLDWGLGGQLGLMNLNEFAGAVVSDLYYPLSGNYIKTSVVFRLSAKYLYYGFTGRVALSRKITDQFSVGVAGGIHTIMSKRDVDIAKPYLSAMASFQINK